MRMEKDIKRLQGIMDKLGDWVMECITWTNMELSTLLHVKEKQSTR